MDNEKRFEPFIIVKIFIFIFTINVEPNDLRFYSKLKKRNKRTHFSR